MPCTTFTATNGNAERNVVITTASSPSPNHICVRNAQMIAGSASRTSSVSFRSASAHFEPPIRTPTAIPSTIEIAIPRPKRGSVEAKCSRNSPSMPPCEPPVTSIHKNWKVSSGAGNRSSYTDASHQINSRNR